MKCANTSHNGWDKVAISANNEVMMMLLLLPRLSTTTTNNEVMMMLLLRNAARLQSTRGTKCNRWFFGGGIFMGIEEKGEKGDLAQNGVHQVHWEALLRT